MQPRVGCGETRKKCSPVSDPFFLERSAADRRKYRGDVRSGRSLAQDLATAFRRSQRADRRRKGYCGGRSWKEIRRVKNRTHGRQHISINEFSGYRVYFRSWPESQPIRIVCRRSREPRTKRSLVKIYASRSDESRKIERTVIT